MTVSVIIATFNERENIEEMIKRIRANIEQAEIIVVDDNSPDKTWEIAQSLDVKVIRRNDKGLASAILRGIIESTGDIICWWDADMLMCPKIAKNMIPLLKDYDIIIGSRYVLGGRDDRALSRVIPSILVNTLANTVLGYGIKDYDSGFIVMRKTALDTVLPIPIGFGEYFIEFIYSAAKRGLHIFEYPYILTDRATGTSKSTTSPHSFIKTGLQYCIRIFTAVAREEFE